MSSFFHSESSKSSICIYLLAWWIADKLMLLVGIQQVAVDNIFQQQGLNIISLSRIIVSKDSFLDFLPAIFFLLFYSYLHENSSCKFSSVLGTHR